MSSRTTTSISQDAGAILSLPPEVTRLVFRALGEHISCFDRLCSTSRRILPASLVHSSWTLPAQEEALRAASRDDGFDIGSVSRESGFLSKMKRYPNLAGQVKKAVLKGGTQELKKAFLRILLNVRDLEVASDGLHDLCWDDLGQSPALKSLSLFSSSHSPMHPSSFATPGLHSLTHLSLGCLPSDLTNYLLSPAGALLSHLPSLTSLAWPEPSLWETEAAITFLSPCIPQLNRLELLGDDEIHLEPIGMYWVKLLPLASNVTSFRVSWEHYFGRTSWPKFIASLPESCRLTELEIYDPDSIERDYHVSEDDLVEVPYKRTYEQLEKDFDRHSFGTLEVLRVFGDAWELQQFGEEQRLEETKAKGDIEKLCQRKGVRLEFLVPLDV